MNRIEFFVPDVGSIGTVEEKEEQKIKLSPTRENGLPDFAKPELSLQSAVTKIRESSIGIDSPIFGNFGYHSGVPEPKFDESTFGESL